MEYLTTFIPKENSNTKQMFMVEVIHNIGVDDLAV